MNAAELNEFCQRWLAAWTGNRPQRLLEFYAADAVYRDPAKPQGLRGHGQIGPYFQRLLAANPGWVWEVVEVMPTAAGCTLKWRTTIPIGDGQVVEQGLDIVEITGGKITRNEVYFDRAALLQATRQAGPAAAAPAQLESRA